MSDFTYISLGAGVQSSYLAVASVLGLHNVPRADVAIFADTQDEPREVYDHLWKLTEWLDARGLPVHVCSRGRLSDADATFLRIPAWTQGDDDRGSPTRRQCTREYKIAPIETYVRQLLGYTRGQRMRHSATSLHGISYDEIQRMKPSRTPWITIEYPLIEARLSRWHCLEYWPRHCDLPLPPRSACVYCPFKTDAEWARLRDTDAEAWAFAVDYDERIRNRTKAGIARPAYLHRSCKPLVDVDLTAADADQLHLWNAECEGMCGV